MAVEATETDVSAEEGAAGDNAQAPKKEKLLSGKRIVLFVVLPLLVFGGGAGAYFMGFLDSTLGVSEEGAEVEEPVEAKDAIFFDLPDMLVNLNSTGRKSNYLKISISLEIESADDEDRIKAVLPRIIDNFQVYLRELRVEDLRGSAGIMRLREQLLKRINVAAAPAKILDVLFREILVQ